LSELARRPLVACKRMFTSRPQGITIVRVYCGHGLAAFDYSGRPAVSFFSTLVSKPSAAEGRTYRASCSCYL